MDSTPRNIISSALYLNIATISARALGLFTSIILARSLGKIQYGQLIFFFSLSSIIVSISDGGMLSYMVREVAKDTDKSFEWLRDIMSLKAIFLLAAAVFLVPGLILFHASPATNIVIIAAFVFSIGKVWLGLADGIFTAWVQMKFPALVEFLFAALLLASCGILKLFNLLTLEHMFIVYCLVIFMLAALAFWQLFRRIPKRGSVFSKPRLEILLASFPFFLSILAGMIFSQSDVLMLRAISGPASTGYYGVALALFSGMMFFVANTVKILFPVFTQLYNESRENFKRYVQRFFWFIYLFVLPIAAGGIFVSEPILRFIYGEQYLPAANALTFLLMAFALQFFVTMLGVILQGCQHQKHFAVINWIAVVISLISGLLLIHFYAHTGAALMRLSVNIFLFLACTWVVNFKIISLNIGLRYLKPLAATALMIAFLIAFPGFNVLVRIFSGAVIYFALLILFRCFTMHEFDLLRSLLHAAPQVKIQAPDDICR